MEPVHPICHRAIHANFSNAELVSPAARSWRRSPPTLVMERFLAWVADKPPDFHAPTRGARR